jgi:type IV pilus assembly protein PilM
MSFREMSAAIRAEAINFIPDDVAAVNLDFDVIGEASGSELDVLVVAVKEEVVEGFLAVAHEARCSVEVVDVDCFALQNCFEMCDPNAQNRTVGLIDVGSTVSSITICRGGNSIFNGDISIGVGRLFEDLARELKLSPQQARDIACSDAIEGDADSPAQSIIVRNLETLTLECSRQLSFYWKAAGTGESIDQLVLSGGGACVRGMSEEVKRRTGIDTVLLDPFRGITMSPGVNLSSVGLEPPMLGVAVGLALRERDDRSQLDYGS